MKNNLLRFHGVIIHTIQTVMIKRLFHISSIVCITLLLQFALMPLQAGGNNDHFRTFKKALRSAENKDYETAMSLYSEILQEEPLHIDALTQLGICMVTTNQSHDSALVLLNKAFDLLPDNEKFSQFGIELQHVIARTHNLREDPGRALEMLNYLRDSVKDEGFRAELSHEISQSRNSAVLLQNPVPLKITNAGSALNSVYDDHSPLISLRGNRIFFTSRRPVGRDSELDDGQYPEKVFFAEYEDSRWKEPKPLGNFFSRNEHKSILSLSPDGSQLFLFKNDRGVKNIYVSRHVNEEWREPEKLPSPVNSEWDETHASLSPDQSTLFFTSNRPGGFGGLDVYMVKKDTYGKWGEAVNMGPHINSPRDEETPMLHPDGTTLYFASEGHSSMGRFDVFYSQAMEDGSWSKPVNMGHPINTPDDDFFFVPTLDKSRAYYASYRFTESVGRSDIYKVDFDSTYNGSLAVIEGTIQNTKNLPPEHIRILVSRESDNELVGDYRPNPANGKYLLFLESGESYTIKEASPENVEFKREIDVPAQVAYNQTNQVVMLQDPLMMPPLSPGYSPVQLETGIPERVNVDDQPADEMVRDTTYTIQILALKHYPEVGLWFLNELEIDSVNALQGRDGFLRYVTGEFSTLAKAEQYRSRIQKSGRYKDAWIRRWEPLRKISEEEKYISGR